MVAVKWNGRGELAVLRGGTLVRWKGHHAVGEDVRWEALPGLARARLHVRVYVPNAMSEYADCVGLDETLRLDFDVDGEGAEGVFQRTGEGGLEAEVAHVLSKVPTGTDSAGSAQGSAAAVRRRDAIGDDGECPVCFSEFGSGEAQVRRAVTPCRHAFCVKCVASVLRMAPPANVGTCPLCRADVRLEELFVE